MLHAGLTGGIASGKSTVSECLQDKGAVIIDHDILSRIVQKPGGIAWKEIVNHFGPDILNLDRSINREKLARTVFSSEEELSHLNRMVHPAVYAQWKQQISCIQGENPDAIIISDVPLLIEVGWYKEGGLIIVVYIDPEEQIRRLMERNGLSHDDAELRLASQMSIREKIRYADFVIDNSGTFEQTKKSVDELWDKLVELQRSKSPQ
jgi:dephospho-CoA kinase